MLLNATGIMFTGIIEAVGRVNSLEMGADSARVAIAASLLDNQLKIGDSVALNGVCLTITARSGETVIAEIGRETLKVTNLGTLKTGDKVNVERPLQLGSRLDGHMVQGHADGVAKIIHINRLARGLEVTFEAKTEVISYIVKRGSVALNGVSLTCIECNERDFKVFLIPHTVESTTFGFAKVGDMVNLEVDIIGKYVEKLTRPGFKRPSEPVISEDFLREHGF